MPSTYFLKFTAGLNAFTFSVAQALLVVLYPFIAERLSLDIAAVIAYFTFGSFLFIFGSPYWASKSDQLGRSKVLSIGTIGLLVSFTILILLIQNPFEAIYFTVFGLVLSRMIYGLVASAISPVSQSWQADLHGKAGAREAMLTHTMALSLGRVAGFIFILLFHDDLDFVLISYMGLVAITLLVNLFTRKKSAITTFNLIPDTTWKSDFLNIKWIAAIAFVFTALMETLNSSLAGRVKQLFLFEGTETAAFTAKILLLASIGIFLVQAYGRVYFKAAWERAMFVAVTALIVGSVVFSTAQSRNELYGSIFFFVIGIGLLPPLYLSALAERRHLIHYGRSAGIIATAHTIGFAFGGFLSAASLNVGGNVIGYSLFVTSIILAVVCFKYFQSAIPSDEKRFA